MGLPVTCAMQDLLGSVLSLDQMMINCGTHMAHVDAPEEAMPVGIVGLRLPQLSQAMLRACASCIHSLVDAQHFLMLVIDLRIAHQKIAPEAAAHKLKHLLIVLFL